MGRIANQHLKLSDRWKVKVFISVSFDAICSFSWLATLMLLLQKHMLTHTVKADLVILCRPTVPIVQYMHYTEKWIEEFSAPNAFCL